MRSDCIVSNMEDVDPEQSSPIQHPYARWLSIRRFSRSDVFFLLLLYALLLTGFPLQFNSDATRYQCYAFAFWHGTHALQTLPAQQCPFLTHPSDLQGGSVNTTLIASMQRHHMPETIIAFVAAQSSTQPYHVLPYEYPLLAVLSFSLALLAPVGWYQAVFAFGMLCIATGLYLLLLRLHSRGAALAFALYLAIGSFVTALGRFDLLPTACAFGALLCAERARWKWAFLLLALATMIKFYPLVLLVPLLVAQQRQQQGPWHALHRYVPVGLFAVTCALVTLLSLAVNVAGTIGPLTYFGQRPLQIESTPASLVWFVSTIGGYPLRYDFSFGSRNVLSSFSALVMHGDTLLLLAGLCLVYWLQWRRKVNLALTFLLTLLLVIVMGKVFSAQYLIWVTPFVAYIGGWRLTWLLSWGEISLTTTLIYPFLYNHLRYPFGSVLPEFYTTIFVRNGLLLLFTCLLLYLVLRNHFRADAQ